MKNTAIIIPTRLGAKRFPNKPMANIFGVPMIERVWRQATKAKIGDVFVACCEKEVFNLINSIHFGALSIQLIGFGELSGPQPLLPFFFQKIELKSGERILFSRELDKPEEKEETMHEKMYKIATSRYNPFSVGGSENCDSDIDCNIQKHSPWPGGSENFQHRGSNDK